MLYKTTTVVLLHTFVTATSEEQARGDARQEALSLLGGMPHIEVKGSYLRPLSDDQVRGHNDLRVWQEREAITRATESQRERWLSGTLPQDELLVLARHELFGPFARFARFQRLTPLDIPHPRTDAGGGGRVCVDGTEIPIAWESRDNPPLSADEWAMVRRIKTAAKIASEHRWLSVALTTSVRVTLRSHVGTCKRCRGTAEVHSALVSILWAGHTLSREYQI